MTTELQQQLANMARQAELRAKKAEIRGRMVRARRQLKDANSALLDDERLLNDVLAQLDAIEAGAGPGVTDDFGAYSTLEQAMQNERFTGKAAAIDFVKANPECTEEEAQAAYVAAALAARPADRQYLLINPDTLRHEYAANLVKYGLIADASWESWRAWVIATDKDTILGIN